MLERTGLSPRVAWIQALVLSPHGYLAPILSLSGQVQHSCVRRALSEGSNRRLICRPGSKVSPTLGTATRVWRTRTSSRTHFLLLLSLNGIPACLQRDKVTKASVLSKGLLSPELNIDSLLLSCLDPPEVGGHSEPPVSVCGSECSGAGGEGWPDSAERDPGTG